MANIKSAKKRILINQRNESRNKAIRSDLRTAFKKAERAIEDNQDNKEELVKAAMKKLDRASKDRILHQNNADRKKSQLQRKLNAAS